MTVSVIKRRLVAAKSATGQRKPRKKPIPRESQQQQALMNWLSTRHPAIYEHTMAIPNGGDRHKATGKNLKKEGVKKGVPDLLVAIPNARYCGLWIEFKAARPHSATVQPEQKEWIQRLNQRGYMAMVCRGIDEAKQQILDYMTEPCFEDPQVHD